MNQKIINLQTDLNEQLNFIDLEIDNEIKRCEKAIEKTLKAKENLKNVVIKSQFKSQDEEIYFFKEIKPRSRANPFAWFTGSTKLHSVPTINIPRSRANPFAWFYNLKY